MLLNFHLMISSISQSTAQNIVLITSKMSTKWVDKGRVVKNNVDNFGHSLTLICTITMSPSVLEQEIFN